MWLSLLTHVLTTSTSLDLSRQQLTNVPGNIPTNETILDLSDNDLVILHQNDFVSLSNLNELYLQNNRLSIIEVGSFNGLSALKKLDLSLNSLEHIPDLLGLVSLKLFKFSENIRMQFVNTTRLAGLYELGTLILNHIEMKNIGPFPRVPKLTDIYLAGNALSHLRPNLLQMCAALTTISLAKNKLDHLPQFAGLERNIQRLVLRSNRIYYFPNFSSFHDLKMLDIRDNFITAVPHYFMPPMTTGSVHFTGNPISCVTELCWLAEWATLTVWLTCLDGTSWSDMTREILCEGGYYLIDKHWSLKTLRLFCRYHQTSYIRRIK